MAATAPANLMLTLQAGFDRPVIPLFYAQFVGQIGGDHVRFATDFSRAPARARKVTLGYPPWRQPAPCGFLRPIRFGLMPPPLDKPSPRHLPCASVFSGVIVLNDHHKQEWRRGRPLGLAE